MAGSYQSGVLQRSEAARAALAEMQRLAKERYIAPFFMCPIYVGLGEHETALDYLERAYEERNEFIVFLNSDESAWMLAPLFPHPRYQALLKKAGFR